LAAPAAAGDSAARLPGTRAFTSSRETWAISSEICSGAVDPRAGQAPGRVALEHGTVDEAFAARPLRSLATFVLLAALGLGIVTGRQVGLEQFAEAHAAAQELCFLIGARQPKLVLMPHTYQVRDFVPKLATAMGRTAITDCVGYNKAGEKLVFTRQMFQGKLAADVSFACDAPWFVTFQNGAFRGDKVEAGSVAAPVETVKVDIADNVIRTKPQAVFKEAKQAVDLTQAEIIVAVGRGIKEQKNIEIAKQLAEALGGEIAASRPICDSGWLPMDRQIGSSGQTVAPKMYMAIGISGAIQHLVGMKGARTIVAINKDANAPIFEVADYGIVGDLFQVVPELIAALKQRT